MEEGTSALHTTPRWTISVEHAIRGFHSVALWVEQGDATVQVLVDSLGFRLISEDGPVSRLSNGDGGPETIVQVRTTGGFVAGASGAGTVHHVAWRIPDDATNIPGFAIDEPVERLGERLMLPPQYEAERARIEAVLPPVYLPRPASEYSFLPAGN